MNKHIKAILEDDFKYATVTEQLEEYLFLNLDIHKLLKASLSGDEILMMEFEMDCERIVGEWMERKFGEGL